MIVDEFNISVPGNNNLKSCLKLKNKEVKDV